MAIYSLCPKRHGPRPALIGKVRVSPALAAKVEFLADLVVCLVALDWREGRGGEHPAAHLVDALEVHLGEGLVALPGFEVV